ncbi:hypothetical protein [Dyella sp. Tek66A03]|uniref:hypothetical protein n=1 Tax=Dyella sp. Tek66A03 TaxID=3458298 RepID=UPI00403E6C5F
MLLFMGTLTAFSVGKIIVGLRTGEIGMYANDSGHTYRRSEEPFGFYRAVVIQGLATMLFGALTAFAVVDPP